MPSIPPSPRTRAAFGPLSRVLVSTGAFSPPGDFELSNIVIAFIAISSGSIPRSIASSRTSRALCAGSISTSSSSIRTNRRASISPCDGTSILVNFPTFFSIRETWRVALFPIISTLRPVRPARPVRPTRWMYVSSSLGKSSWMTRSTRSTSIPLDATSVATSKFVRPSRNRPMTLVRSA